MNYPKRLIEVDLPIKRISAHARREKSIRHGHISTLHIWWARRPLAACRAVICAALWPDPADPLCPQAFREAAAKVIQEFAAKVVESRQLKETCDPLSFGAWVGISKSGNHLDPANPAHLNALRNLLLDFIADFANWDNSTVPAYLDAARALTQAAHEALGGAPGSRPLVVDPFAGGGSIPLEALRVGADAFASDLNPVAVLLNKVVLEYIPRYGQRLADEVRKWGQWIKEQAEQELAPFYPKDPDGATPIAYLWARTIRCEGPGCGAEVPLMNQTIISKRRHVEIKITAGKKGIELDINNAAPERTIGTGTVKNGKVTCPACGFTMSADRYRQRAKNGELGERHFCTVLALPDGTRRYRNPTTSDAEAFTLAKSHLSKANTKVKDLIRLEAVPNENLSESEPRRLNVLQYGFDTWGTLFNDRQKLCFVIFSSLLSETIQAINKECNDKRLAIAISTVLGLTISNITQYNCNMSTWLSDGMISVFIQSSSIPMRADYAEANPLMDRLVGGFQYQIDRAIDVISTPLTNYETSGRVALQSATVQSLPFDSIDALITDPPYYFAIPYAVLSDFFYVWIKRLLGVVHSDLFLSNTTPKDEEAIQNLPHSKAIGQKDRSHFELKIYESLHVSKEEIRPSGIAVVVFAHASTEGWESLLKSLLSAGWIITASWPIDTEKEGRMLASRQRSLASSVHLVCRPRENPDGSLINEIGDWRTVLAELPQRIHEWMPRLAQEGVVGADAIFACLGPALEVFSRYSRVEKASGEVVTLREYLEQVWAAVAREALNMIFTGADASGFEENARLTAMWLWTLTTEAKGGNGNGHKASAEAEGGDEDEGGSGKAVSGFSLEYDAARKIAQGLGAHLEALGDLVEVKGDTARLLPVAERGRALFGRQGLEAPKRRKKEPQGKLFAELEEAEQADGGWGALKAPKLGDSVLDRLHQAMLLFAAGRGEALKRFLVEDGAGKDQRFWRLAQALSALYPAASDEKRWVDGVLARKKGLGL